MNSDCKERLQIVGIVDCKESEDYIIVTDKPSPKRCKLEPEENLHRKLIRRDGHCIVNYFAEHLKKILTKFKTNWTQNFR